MKITHRLRLPTRRREPADRPRPQTAPKPKPARSKPRARARPPRGGPRLTVRTRIGRATGKADNTRYQLDAVRVLPGPKRDRVLVQATDGHQAVCLIAPGSCDQPALIPGDVLPTRKTAGDVEVTGDRDGWRATDGKRVDRIDAPKHFPDIGEVLPVVQGKGVKPPVMLGIDLTVLGKVADALGTPKLTLIIPPPPPEGGGRPEDGKHVNKPVAVCPADAAGVHGIAVVMPVTPEYRADYYTKVRKDVIAAEKRHPRKLPRKPQNPRKPAPATGKTTAN